MRKGGTTDSRYVHSLVADSRKAPQRAGMLYNAHSIYMKEGACMAWSYEGMSLAEAWRSADDVAEDDELLNRQNAQHLKARGP